MANAVPNAWRATSSRLRARGVAPSLPSTAPPASRRGCGGVVVTRVHTYPPHGASARLGPAVFASRLGSLGIGPSNEAGSLRRRGARQRSTTPTHLVLPQCFRPFSSSAAQRLSATSAPRRRGDLVGGGAHAQYDYAIVGGGLSGLSLALFLSRSQPEARVLLLEAQPRLGGWVQSERVTLVRGSGGGGEEADDVARGGGAMQRGLWDAAKATLAGARRRRGSGEDAREKQTALVEGGPRSIRPTGLAGFTMVELIRSLGLESRMLMVPKTAASARNRFVYFPDRLNRLPSSLVSAVAALARLPVLRGVVPALAGEMFRASRFQRPASESEAEKARLRSREVWEDESVDAYFRRRLGERGGGRLVGRLVSAVLHGIYAGDARRLSVRSVLGLLWNAEARHGSLLRAALLPRRFNARYREPTPAELARERREADELRAVETSLGSETVARLKRVSVFSFPDGVEELVGAMTLRLQSAPNVRIRVAEQVETAEVDDDGAIQIKTDKESYSAQQMLASIPSRQLSQLLRCDALAPTLEYNPSANVGVVNVAIPSWVIGEHLRERGRGGAERASSWRLLPVEGFGYLLPRLTPDNGDGILGVVFDSDSLPTQDAAEPLAGAGEGGRGGGGRADGAASHDARATPTKLTVMMGGPHWPHLDEAQLPTPEQCRDAALRALATQLSLPDGVLRHADVRVVARLQRECIPHYVVGHLARMRTLHETLLGVRRGGGGGCVVTAKERAAPGERTDDERERRRRADASWLGSGRLVLAGASYTGVSLNDVVLNAKRTAERLTAARRGATVGTTTTTTTTGRGHVESKGESPGIVTGLESLVE